MWAIFTRRKALTLLTGASALMLPKAPARAQTAGPDVLQAFFNSTVLNGQQPISDEVANQLQSLTLSQTGSAVTNLSASPRNADGSPYTGPQIWNNDFPVQGFTETPEDIEGITEDDDPMRFVDPSSSSSRAEFFDAPAN